MSIINNENTLMLESLRNALSTSDRIDIAVGFFYFSGFEALAEELKDKKVRILVGLEIDSQLIPQITQLAREGDVDLTKWQPRMTTTSKTALKTNYAEALVGFVNDSDIFDEESSSKVFDLFMKKIEDGTLEIRKTLTDYHGKFYLVHSRKEISQNGDFPGTLFLGSSNMTYRGLVGQGELNDSFRDKSKFDEYMGEFEKMWNESNSISIADQYSKEDFIRTIKPKLWKYATPSPYEIYIRILHEMFSKEEKEEVRTPSSITGGLFTDLEYQVDAVKAVIDKLDRYDGAILADVVGLGKSVIGSAVANNLELKTVIIAPPHLISQWEDYKEEFKIIGSKVFSSGKIVDVYEKYKESRDPILFIIDEAHRFRNEDTGDYKLLHQVCRSNPDNKVLLLTATPFNNDPKDVFALIKLFQTPGQATIRSIDNLSLRYRELIQRYKKLRRSLRKEGVDIDKEADEIALEQRRLIEPIIIRRSRLDLKHITRYREDLQRQGVDFAEIVGPELLEYNLGELEDLYVSTLGLITQEDNVGFIGARYKPTSEDYMTEENQRIFFAKYKHDFDDIEDLRIAQRNMADQMKRLLVMRFESSKNAFKSTLEKMIASNKLIEHWWDSLGIVPIMKKGQLPDPENYDEEDGDSVSGFDVELNELRNKRGFIEIEKELLNPIFIEHVRHDTQLLTEIHQRWFGDNRLSDADPKLSEMVNQVSRFLKENPSRKIVVFSVYKDTVDYLYEKLLEKGFSRVAKYTASEGNETYKKVIKSNFDASYPKEKQSDDYDLLIATDALSEGFNLHRAGIIINYDIPYNPTRVIQRVGRINRINKKVFDQLFVLNCFPTVIGETETKVKSISTLKIKLINAVVGSDTKTLTSEEELKSFFRDSFNKAQQESEQMSWDTKYFEIYDQVRGNKEVIEMINKLPRRSRIQRDHSQKGVLVFGKKGGNFVFTLKNSDTEVQVVSPEIALPLFESSLDEKARCVDKDFNDTFKVAKDKLFAKNELPQMKGRRAEAIKFLEGLAIICPSSKEYCDDIKTIIREYDDINDGALKDITQIRVDRSNPQLAYERLQEIVPQSYVTNINNKVERAKSENELLLFAEQLV